MVIFATKDGLKSLANFQNRYSAPTTYNFPSLFSDSRRSAIPVFSANDRKLVVKLRPAESRVDNLCPCCLAQYVLKTIQTRL